VVRQSLNRVPLGGLVENRRRTYIPDTTTQVDNENEQQNADGYYLHFVVNILRVTTPPEKHHFVNTVGQEQLDCGEEVE